LQNSSTKINTINKHTINTNTNISTIISHSNNSNNNNNNNTHNNSRILSSSFKTYKI
jgi:hypothetical protein